MIKEFGDAKTFQGDPPCPERASASSPLDDVRRPISAEISLDRLAPMGPKRG